MLLLMGFIVTRSKVMSFNQVQKWIQEGQGFLGQGPISHTLRTGAMEAPMYQPSS